MLIKWSNTDLVYLEKNYKSQTAKEIALILGRSIKSIQKKAFLLNLCKDRKNWNGLRNGQLNVIEELAGKTIRCRCDCGNIVQISKSNFTKTFSCKCSTKGINSGGHKRPNYKGCGEIYGKRFYTIKKQAAARNIIFDITIEQMWSLFLKQDRKCAITGMGLKFPSSSGRSDGTASLDRIISTNGYTIDNIQWVHKDINELKWDKTYEELLSICKKVVEYARIKNK